MANRTANYAAFYVSEPFSESNLGANATPDFLYYNQLRAWKGADSSLWMLMQKHIMFEIIAHGKH